MSKTITCIIPAFNEEKNIKGVLRIAKKALLFGIISEIIVVDDGSRDKTKKEALKFKVNPVRKKRGLNKCPQDLNYYNGVKVLRNSKNQGKAAALMKGLTKAKGEITIFLDADLLNLKVEHILKLVEPVLEEKKCMTVAKFVNGRLSTTLAHALNINCSGQRAAETKVFKEIFKTVKNIEKVKYGIENIITDRLEEFKIKPIIIEWNNVSQVLKEEKWGLTIGFFQRIRMYFSMSLGHFRNFFYNLSKILDIKEKTS